MTSPVVKSQTVSVGGRDNPRTDRGDDPDAEASQPAARRWPSGLNERNVTWSDTSVLVGKEDTSAVAELKERYKAIRAKIAQRTSKDRRVKRSLLSKYGKREKDRTTQAIHRITKRIVDHAKKNDLAVIMENLKGIRKLYRKGNGQGTSFRGRMNSWTFQGT